MMIDKKPRVLFIKPWSGSTFIENDEKILRKHFDASIFDWSAEKHPEYKILKILLKKDVDLIFMWFATRYFAPIIFLSRLFGTPSVVIAGGFDVAYVPEIDYGQFTMGWRKKMFTKFVLKYANKVLVVDPSLKEDAIKNAKISGDNIEYLPTGYDADYWKSKGKKENIVVTVGAVNNSVVKRKGFRTFVEAAKHVPNAKFVLIGKHRDNSIDYLQKVAPSNVEFTGFVSDKELLQWYQKAKIYCQLSRYEGLPNALCEAMLCECVPVGTKYCGIPTGIGDTGFYVSYSNERETAKAIKKALDTPDEFGKKARKRIKEKFPLERREKELVKIIDNITQIGK